MDTKISPWLRRLPRYVYLADLIKGRRIVELNCGTGYGAMYLASHGAEHVIGVDDSPQHIRRASAEHNVSNLEFRCEKSIALELEDSSVHCIIVPNGDELLRQGEVLTELRRVLIPEGYLILAASSADRLSASGGVSFHEFAERLSPAFSPVRMVAESPFIATALVEYRDSKQEPEVELDTSLLDLEQQDDDVFGYVAICGGSDDAPKGFTVVQVPSAAGLSVIGPGVQGDSDGDNPLVTKGLRAREAEARRHAAELQIRLDQAQQEVGRVAGQAAIELNQTRREVAVLREQLQETKAALSQAEHTKTALSGQSSEQTLPEAGYEVVEEAADEQGTGDYEVIVQQTEQPLDGGAPVVGTVSEFDQVPTREQQASITEQINLAMQVHAEELKQAKTQLKERDTYIEELRQDLKIALEEAGLARIRATELETVNNTMKAELSQWRDRASIAEGKVLRAEHAARSVEEERAAERDQETLLKQTQESLEQQLAEEKTKLLEQRQAAQQAMEYAMDESSKKLVLAQDKLTQMTHERDELAQNYRDAVLSVERTKQELAEATAAEVENKQQLEKSEAEREQLEIRLRDVATSRAQLEAKMQKMSASIEEFEDKVRAAEAHNEALTQALDLADSRLGANGVGRSTAVDATDRLQSLRGKADSIEQELASSRALLKELEQGVSVLGQAVNEIDDETPVAFSTQERIRRLAIELGVKEAELTLMNLGVSTLQQRLHSVVELVQHTRDSMSGSATEMKAAVDGLVRSVIAYTTGTHRGG